MSLAEKICLSAAFLFFMTGLLTGIWKYRHMARSENAASPVYVDIAHRSSLLYSFAALLLAAFSAQSVFADWINVTAALAALLFFALAIGTYVVHGLLQDRTTSCAAPIGWVSGSCRPG